MKKFSTDIFQLRGLPSDERAEILAATLIDPATPPDVVEQILIADYLHFDELGSQGSIFDTAISVSGIGESMWSMPSAVFARSDLDIRIVQNYVIKALTDTDFVLSCIIFEGATRRQELDPGLLEAIYRRMSQEPLEINNHAAIISNILRNPNCPENIKRVVQKHSPRYFDKETGEVLWGVN